MDASHEETRPRWPWHTSHSAFASPGQSLDPEQGLRDRNIALHFRVRRIGLQSFPKVEVPLLAQRETREEEGRLPRGPAFPRLDVWLVGPLGFVGEVGIEERHRLADAAAVGELELPEVVLWGGED